MIRVVAILETMWDWRKKTSQAGYTEAPRFFRINPQNHSGRRLYKFVGPNAKLLVTNACRELVSGPNKHGKGDPAWLADNLKLLDENGCIDILLVCGKIAQETFDKCLYNIESPHIIKLAHPAARTWNSLKIHETMTEIQTLITDLEAVKL